MLNSNYFTDISWIAVEKNEETAVYCNILNVLWNGNLVVSDNSDFAKLTDENLLGYSAYILFNV